MKLNKFRNFFNSETAVLTALSVFIFAFSFSPLFKLILAAVMPENILDFKRLTELLAKKRVIMASINTLQIAFFSAVLSSVIGTLTAAVISLTNIRYKTFYIFIFILPMIIPPQVTALSWIQAVSPSSIFMQMLGLSFTYGRHPLFSMNGIIFLLGITNAPLVFLAVRASLRRLPADLIEVAQASGASPLRLFFTIVIPLSKAGILAGTALAFISSAGNFGIQAMLGIPARIPTLINLIYQQLNNFGPSALSDMAAFSVVIALITILGLSFTGGVIKNRDVQLEGGIRNKEWSLKKFRTPVEIFGFFYFILFLVLPVSSLVINSLLGGIGQKFIIKNITFSNYYAVLVKHEAVRQAFMTSLFLTIAATFILMTLAFFLSYFLVRKKSYFVSGIQIGTELAYALPGIVIGVSAILFFLKPIPIIGFSIYGSIWLILTAYISHYLALILRPAIAGITQIDRSIDEAAQVYGAGFIRRIRDIIIPVAAPSLAAGGIISFLTIINEIQVSILLVTSRARTIGPMIIFLEESNASTSAAAVGCLMILLILMFMSLTLLFSKKIPAGILPWQN